MAPFLMSKNGDEDNETTFHKFFERWLAKQNQQLKELVSASRDINKGNNYKKKDDEQRVLVPLIGRVMHHYEEYYGEKSKYTKEDVLGILNPSWISTLEGALLWIGGWRPSMAFHLLYSKSGLQLETHLHELIRGVKTGDLGDLSSSQMGKVDELQKKTIREERASSEKLAKVQGTIADIPTVDLSHVVTQMNRDSAVEVLEEQVEENIATKEKGLVIILQKADNLRLNTLKEILDILTPTQAVHFLIAAAELHLRFHEWGMKKDAVYS